MRRADLVAVSLAVCVLASFRARAAEVDEPGALGPYEVGAVSYSIADPERGRDIPLIVWYPTEDRITDETPAAIYQQPPLPFTATGAEWAPFVGRTVHGGVSVASGRFPLVLSSHGQMAAGFFEVYRMSRIASHGFVVVSMTHREGNLGVPPFFPGPVLRANRLADTRRVLDHLLDEANQTPGDLLFEAIDPDRVFGIGHSLGGYTMIAVADPRLAGIVTYDGTREALTVAQIEAIAVPFLPFGQHCRGLQMELQHYARSDFIGMEGFTPQVSAVNHGLFLQSCMARSVNEAKPLPPGFPPPPPQLLANCANPVFRALERHFADVTTKYTIAFLRASMGEARYRAYLAPGQVREAGVHFIEAAPGPHGGAVGDGFHAFCSQPGDEPGDVPLDHLFITLP
jgi:hypothetical protein